jgi:hypothetical protein
MAVCDVCGNDYDKAFEVRAGGATHVFDSFECAIHARQHALIANAGSSATV